MAAAVQVSTATRTASGSKLKIVSNLRSAVASTSGISQAVSTTDRSADRTTTAHSRSSGDSGSSDTRTGRRRGSVGSTKSAKTTQASAVRASSSQRGAERR